MARINGEYDPNVMRDMINENRRQLGIEPMPTGRYESVNNLTELQHSSNIKGSLALYVFDENGMHRGPQYFRRTLRYPGEEITVGQAHNLAFAAVNSGREVRITDSGDMLVFHAKDGKILYPESPAKFWEECG